MRETTLQLLLGLAVEESPPHENRLPAERTRLRLSL